MRPLPPGGGGTGWGGRAARAFLLAAIALFALALGPAAQAADKLIFGTNWKAEAEHGGFYQALAEGRYAKAGLEVEIRQGGPLVNHSQLLAAGVIDAAMTANDAQCLNFLKNDIPMVTVAAFFQKDPQVLLTHPERRYASIREMKGKPIMISADSRETWWRFLRLSYGFDDSQIRPYVFQMGPFLADKNAIQQGYVTSEPYLLLKNGVKANVYLLADTGWPSYSTLVTVAKALIEKKPHVVQRFVNASIEGWYSYLYGDPAPGNRLIKAANPEMTDDLLAYGIAKMKEYGIVDSGDSLKLGIGAMTEAKLKAFFDLMARDGVYPASMDFMAAFDLRFVNQGHGIGMRR